MPLSIDLALKQGNRSAAPPTAEDYDMEGYTAKYGQPDQSKGQHLTDEFKLPPHITFSTDSKYSTPETPGGVWKQVGGVWHYAPSPYVIAKQGRERLIRYFKEHEPNSVLELPSGGGLDIDAALGGAATPPQVKPAPKAQELPWWVRAPQAVSQAMPSAGEAAVNFPGDVLSLGGELASGAYNMVRHPVQTAEGLAEVGRQVMPVAAGLTKHIGGKPSEADSAAADRMLAWVRQNATPENLKNYVEQHPAHALMNVGLALGAGGTLVKAAGWEQTGAKLAEAGGKLAVAPFTKPAKAAGAVGKAAANWAGLPTLPEKIMARAQKLPPGTSREVRAEVAATAVKEGAPLTGKGIESLQAKIFDLQPQVREIIKPVARKALDPQTILQRARELLGPSAQPEDAAARKGILAFYADKMKDGLTVGQAHELKKDIYRRLASYYRQGERVETPGIMARQEVKAKVAQALKEAVEQVAPGVKALHAEEGRLIQAVRKMTPRVSALENRNPLVRVALDSLLGTGGYMLGGPAGGALGVVLVEPAMQSRLAVWAGKLRDADLSKVRGILASKLPGASKAAALKQAGVPADIGKALVPEEAPKVSWAAQKPQAFEGRGPVSPAREWLGVRPAVPTGPAEQFPEPLSTLRQTQRGGLAPSPTTPAPRPTAPRGRGGRTVPPKIPATAPEPAYAVGGKGETQPWHKQPPARALKKKPRR